MGLFNIFSKKNKNSKETQEEKKQPLTLQYTDGTIANITFKGIEDIDGKIVHSANIVYLNTDGTFNGKTVLLEPIMNQDTNGKWIDATEQYYRQMSTRDGSRETQASYNAVKGFFKKQDIEESVIGSNYIGSLARTENGEYFRNYDNNFKLSCVKKCKEKRQAVQELKQQREVDFFANLQREIEDKPVNIKTSHAEHLTQEKYQKYNYPEER